MAAKLLTVHLNENKKNVHCIIIQKSKFRKHFLLEVKLWD